jgi:hypothetical protein
VKGVISGPGNCGKVFKAITANKVRVTEVLMQLLPQLSSGNLRAVQLRLMLASGIHRDVIVGSVYMPYNSENVPPQEDVDKLVAYASNKGLKLLLGCDANSHHEVWGCTDINLRRESLLDFILCTQLHILIRREPTFLDSRRQKVLDITLCTRG